jgi:hypothetical protein
LEVEWVFDGFWFVEFNFVDFCGNLFDFSSFWTDGDAWCLKFNMADGVEGSTTLDFSDKG